MDRNDRAIDLLIVIVGVFIGIQVSNWNVEREANQRVAVFADRLKADLQEEAWYYAEARRRSSTASLS